MPLEGVHSLAWSMENRPTCCCKPSTAAALTFKLWPANRGDVISQGEPSTREQSQGSHTCLRSRSCTSAPMLRRPGPSNTNIYEQPEMVQGFFQGLATTALVDTCGAVLQDRALHSSASTPIRAGPASYRRPWTSAVAAAQVRIHKLQLYSRWFEGGFLKMRRLSVTASPENTTECLTASEVCQMNVLLLEA